MTILLDAGPLGMVSNPKASRRNRDCYDWLLSTIADGTRVLVPEIADYEVRRKGKCLTLIGTEGTLIEEIIVDAHGEDEQLWAFRQVMEDEVPLPIDGFVLGEPVAIVEIAYDGNERRGLTARCRRNEGSEHVVSLADVQVARQAKAARYVAAYRKWLGLEPAPAEGCGSSSRAKAHKAADEDIRLDGPVELVVLSVKDRAVRCRLANSTRVVTLRSGRLWTIVPGQIISVRPSKHWRYAGHPYLSGEIETARIDAQGLGLVPLRLHEQGDWDPAEEYWGEGRSRHGRSPSYLAGRDPCTRWSRCYPAPTQTIGTAIRSPNRMIAKMPATSSVRGIFSAACSRPTYAVWTHTLISATWSSIAGQTKLCVTTRSAYASESYPSAVTSTECSRGA